jgi:hypothetical protein
MRQVQAEYHYNNGIKQTQCTKMQKCHQGAIQQTPVRSSNERFREDELGNRPSTTQALHPLLIKNVRQQALLLHARFDMTG